MLDTKQDDPIAISHTGFSVMDIVAVSRTSFSAGVKDAVLEARRVLGDCIEGVEIGPPWHVVVTPDGDVEFRNTVRIMYKSAP